LVWQYLLHLDGTRGLAGEIVADTADTVNLVDNASRDLGQELVAEGIGSGGHEITGGDGTEEDDVSVDTLVTHNTDGARRVKGSVGLANVVVETGLADHGDEDIIGLTGHLDLLLGNLTKNTDGETGAREGVAANKLSGDVHLATELTDLILEQLTQGLNELETVASHQALSNTTDVVVGLDSLRGTLEGDTLDDIGVEGTLQEPLDLTGTLGLNSSGLSLEHIDELATNELALLLGVILTLKTSEELLTGINDSQVNTQLLLQHILDESALVQTHATVVNKDSVETVTNGLSHQLGSNGRVNTTANGTNDLTGGANELTNALNLLTNELRHGPCLLGTTDADSEVLQKLTTLGGVYQATNQYRY